VTEANGVRYALDADRRLDGPPYLKIAEPVAAERAVDGARPDFNG
jgi:hypothetical protein